MGGKMIKLYKILDKDRTTIGYASSESRNRAKGYIAVATKKEYKQLLVNRVYEKDKDYIEDMVKKEGELAIKLELGDEFYRTNIQEIKKEKKGQK